MGKYKANYQWTAGGSRHLKHKNMIATGGFGEVHMVHPYICRDSLTGQMEDISTRQVCTYRGLPPEDQTDDTGVC